MSDDIRVYDLNATSGSTALKRFDRKSMSLRNVASLYLASGFMLLKTLALG